MCQQDSIDIIWQVRKLEIWFIQRVIYISNVTNLDIDNWKTKENATHCCLIYYRKYTFEKTNKYWI